MNILKIKQKKKKKGAIELSLNLIIMLIIGLVILGLVITFVKKMVGKAEGSMSDQLDSQEKEIANEMMQDSNPFEIYPSKVTVSANTEKTVLIKIRNLDNKISVDGGNLCGNSKCEIKYYNSDGTTSDAQPTNNKKPPLSIYGTGFDLKPGEVTVVKYTLTANLNPGTYFVIMHVNDVLNVNSQDLYDNYRFTLIVQ